MSELLDETVGPVRVRCAAAAIASGTGPTVFPGDLRLDVATYVAGQLVHVPARVAAGERARLAVLIAPPPPARHGSDLSDAGLAALDLVGRLCLEERAVAPLGGQLIRDLVAEIRSLRTGAP